MIRTNKGFTLIELMVVIVIIGVLAALAIPKFTDASVKAKAAEAPTVLSTFDHAALARIAETGQAPAAMTDMVIEDPTASADFSKYYTYVFTAAAAAGDPVTLVATGKDQLGSFLSGKTVGTSVDPDNTVTHSNHDDFEKYIPNWDND